VVAGNCASVSRKRTHTWQNHAHKTQKNQLLRRISFVDFALEQSRQSKPQLLAARLHLRRQMVQRKNNNISRIKGENMKMQRTIFASVGVALLFATVSFAQQVKTDYDRSTDFSQYKTYSWEKVQTPDALWVDRIKEAVNSELAGKGLTPVASGGDISIIAIEVTHNQQTLNTFYDGFGGGWRWGGGFGNATTTTETYKVGTLVVDLFDAKSKKLVWRGSSSDTLSDKSDKNIKNLDKGVKKMFDHFPPSVKK
jgi:hypothetical protein